MGEASDPLLQVNFNKDQKSGNNLIYPSSATSSTYHGSKSKDLNSEHGQLIPPDDVLVETIKLEDMKKRKYNITLFDYGDINLFITGIIFIVKIFYLF